MLLIECPFCGPRAEVEFRCSGEGHIARPEAPDSIPDEAWADYVYMRTNPKGLHFERWMHQHGCRRWFCVARDTVTHKIAAIYKLGEPKPALQDPTTETGKGA